ncbi:MAG: sulfatase-like hydrolase/transferase [Steroidobacteraceae bacterium]
MVLALGAVLASAAPRPEPAPRPAKSAPHRPNLLVIVADDLGFSDLGAFGGEIDTPNLDGLARAGVRLTGFHTAPTCSPTRAMLLSGVDNHLAGLGTMGEAITDVQRGHEGYEGYLNRRVVSVAELLHDAGYFTAQAGKWHLGIAADQSPAARGFERSYTLLQGGHNHFGMDQGEPWRALGVTSTYREDGELVHYPEGRFSGDVFTEHMLGYLDEARRSGRPFFAYLTFSEPHWPLQAPAELIAKYRGRYDAGPEALRERRLAALRKLGLVAEGVTPHPLVGVPAWGSLEPEQRAEAARRMEVYAAMVDSLDRNVGRVLERLRANGQFADTLIVFISDNGAEGSTLTAPMGGLSGDRPMYALTPAQMATLGIDNSLANIGNASSYVSYGPAWAQAATAPRNRYKGLTTEGGINAPAIIVGPGVKGGRVVGSFTHVLDLAPTLLRVAGVAHPDSYQGHAVLPLEGHAWVDMLAGRANAAWPADAVVGWELFWRRAVRKGEWKAVFESEDPGLASTQPGRWHLYHLAHDPGEVTDLADVAPAKLAELTQAWEAYARRTGVLTLPAPTPTPTPTPAPAPAPKPVATPAAAPAPLPAAAGAPAARNAAPAARSAAPAPAAAPHRCGASDVPANIPAGEVLLGEDGPAHPGRRTRVAAFRIDRHEVTNRQYAAFVAATGYVTRAEREGRGAVFQVPFGIVDMSDYRQWWRFVDGAGWRHPRGPGSEAVPDEPVVQVTYEDALAYAQWAGRALPSVAQWERAARGDQRGPRARESWAYGPDGRPLVNSWQGEFPVRNAALDGYDGLAPVGCFPANAFGLVDMVGNAWEWTRDEGDGRGATRIIKGGSFLCARNYCANFRPAAWQAQEHDMPTSHVGFRTVAGS